MKSGSKTALITGGARGIGWGIAEAMLKAGYHVTVTGLTEAEVGAAPSRPGLRAVRLDVTSDAEVAALFAGVERLDALVNCAGVIMRGAEFDIAAFQKVIDVNLTGTMRMCVAARPKLAASGEAAIVNTASMLSFFGGAMVPAYAASKGGVAQLTKSLAIGYAADRIRVNAIAPGWINTDISRGGRENPEFNDRLMQRLPAKRWADPDELAGTALFLASSASALINGVTIPVDGGYVAA